MGPTSVAIAEKVRALFLEPTKTVYINKRFVPKEDITAYEVACVIARHLGQQEIPFRQEDWDALPENLKRHFEHCNPYA